MSAHEVNNACSSVNLTDVKPRIGIFQEVTQSKSEMSKAVLVLFTFELHWSQRWSVIFYSKNEVFR
jgi:hypothetical protein